MNATTFQAFAESDLYVAGVRDDGREFIGEQYFVVVENEAGRRFRHQAIFNGAKQIVCPETGESGFVDLRDEASAKAERLAERVNDALAAGQRLDAACWVEIDPAYGSDEYAAQGVEAQRAFQDRQAA